MNKRAAVEQMVHEDFNGIPTDWVEIVAREKGEELGALPMWGTMFLVTDFIGERLMERSRLMVGEAQDIDLEAIEDEKEREEVKTAIEDLKKESIAWGGVAILEDYVDEEMAGAHCILDKDGGTTAAFIYEVDGNYLVGINGAGWNFYDGVWDRIYDTLGLQWHDEEHKEEKP